MACTVCLGGVILWSVLFTYVASYLGLHCLPRRRHIMVCTVNISGVMSGSALFT